MTVKSKFKVGDTVYFKYPSRYSRRKDHDTIEALVYIEAVTPMDTRHNLSTDYMYTISLVKVIKAKPNHWSSIIASDYIGHAFGIDTLELETYSRRLTPAERVLYG